MPKRFPDLLVEDMLDCIQTIQEFIQQTPDIKALESNRLVRDAIVRNFEVLGEAANQLPDEIHQTFNAIPWRKIIGLRNRLIHDYTDVNVIVMWQIIEVELSPLSHQLAEVLTYCKKQYPWP